MNSNYYIIIAIVILLFIGFLYIKEKFDLSGSPNDGKPYYFLDPYQNPPFSNNTNDILCGCRDATEISPRGSEWPPICLPVQSDRTIAHGWAGAPVKMPAMALNPTATW